MGRCGAGGRRQGARRLLTDDFLGVGPLGFALPKAVWLGRFEQGLTYETFELDEVQTRIHGDAAVVTLRQDQQGSHGGQPIPEAAEPPWPSCATQAGGGSPACTSASSPARQAPRPSPAPAPDRSVTTALGHGGGRLVEPPGARGSSGCDGPLGRPVQLVGTADAMPSSPMSSTSTLTRSRRQRAGGGSCCERATLASARRDPGRQRALLRPRIGAAASGGTGESSKSRVV